MSVSRTTYVIVGYDLTEFKNELLSEGYSEIDEYNNLTCYQEKGNVQIFTDPMSGEYLYYGYIVFAQEDDWGGEGFSKASIEDIKIAENQLHSLDNPFQKKVETICLEPSIICFNEYW